MKSGKRYNIAILSKSLLLIAFSLFSILNLANAQSDSIKSIPVEVLRSDLNALISSSDFANANIGICVQSLETGEYIYQHNESKNFIPASTQKIITTAAGLDLLGEDFRFSTKMYLDGNLSPNGIFAGNLILRGLGDPTISKYFYKEPLEIIDSWVRKLDSLGITSINGNLIGDDSYFDDTYYGPGWSWDDFTFYYSAQVSALSFNDNRVDFYIFSGDSAGATARLTPYPVSSYYRIINSIRTVSDNYNKIIISRTPNGNILNLTGSVPYELSRKTSQNVSITIDNPTHFLLDQFKNKLIEHNIRFTGGVFQKSSFHENIDYTQINPIIEFYSPSLKDIIPIVNQESHNLAAEMLFKTLGKESSGTGSFESGSEFVMSYLQKAGVNTQTIRILDGSGLSRLNLISPDNLVKVLNYIYRSPYSENFMNSLAKPGDPGTLKRRMTRSKAEKSVLAKTGSMNNVSAICGYVTSGDGEIFSFSIMMQNFTVPITMATNLQDLILMRLSGFYR
ncbi:MAG: D-alanyl-D-alanine carboxypeptidase/D-alanyl-D-alanine-endopeptidase [Candidatus Kapabacteria bacterium]|nr:D-alanyl-D-alanine carboxypeptidase/D-alanyl-D-alanine-endopeptidase [Ignavibacteriota bacterium]MCW5884434.1 D-alanyl-D-alanine carboxypeptidase/D-alanyl-D-alanine-endopeptidase [Candidatus Kapabacteria bacterium]